MASPGQPTPCRNRRHRLMRRLHRARGNPRLLALGGLLLCGGVWLATLLPQPQPLEGTLEATAIRFTLPPSLPEEGVPFLGLALRSLSLSSLSEDEPLRVTISGQTLELAEGNSLTLQASAPKPGPGQVLFLQMRLPAGARLRELRADGARERELRLELRPPDNDANLPPVSLVITPNQPLQVRLSEPDAATPTVPTSEFSPVVKGPVQLRLQPMDTREGVAFEPALPVRNLTLDAETPSLFNGTPLIRSSLRSGELHLGRREPLKLRPDQVLLIQPPGVNELTDLRLLPDGTTFALAVVGESTALSSGLSRKHPTTVVQGTSLSRFLNPEQIAGFYGVLAGAASIALLVLFRVD